MLLCYASPSHLSLDCGARHAIYKITKGPSKNKSSIEKGLRCNSITQSLSKKRPTKRYKDTKPELEANEELLRQTYH